jgi:hypothetical protein
LRCTEMGEGESCSWFCRGRDGLCLRAGSRNGRIDQDAKKRDRRHNQKLIEAVWLVRTRFRFPRAFRKLELLCAAIGIAAGEPARGFLLKKIALVCGLLSGALGALAALAFLKGSKPMPSDVRSGGGPAEAGKTFRTDALRWNKLGVAMLLAAFVLSAAASVAGYFE